MEKPQLFIGNMGAINGHLLSRKNRRVQECQQSNGPISQNFDVKSKRNAYCNSRSWTKPKTKIHSAANKRHEEQTLLLWHRDEKIAASIQIRQHPHLQKLQNPPKLSARKLKLVDKVLVPEKKYDPCRWNGSRKNNPINRLFVSFILCGEC